MRQVVNTQFASAERSPEEIVIRQYEMFSNLPVLKDFFLGKIDQYILVLNSNRQIVFSNESFNSDFGIDDVTKVLGKRVGEALDCRFAWQVVGCGTSDFCRECGAAKAMLETQTKKKKDVYRECIILTKKNSKTLELGVTSKHISINSEDFVIFTVTDISNDKQKRELEEIFYHDISNIAGGLHSMLQLLHDDRITDKSKILNQLKKTAQQNCWMSFIPIRF